ncbi:MAG: hypothetical protein AAB557_03850 [Patescibacteria group bacterium]
MDLNYLERGIEDENEKIRLLGQTEAMRQLPSIAVDTFGTESAPLGYDAAYQQACDDYETGPEHLLIPNFTELRHDESFRDQYWQTSHDNIFLRLIQARNHNGTYETTTRELIKFGDTRLKEFLRKIHPR